MRVHRGLFLPLFLASMVVSCSAAEPADPVRVRDSVGIQIVANLRPEWTEASAWTLGHQPVLDIGGDPTQALYRVQAIQALQDGVAVLNGGSSEVLFFQFDGTLRWRAGGRGEGPKEFSRPTDLYRCAGDTLRVNDFTRVTTLGPAGRFVRSDPLVARADEQVLRVRGVDAACEPVLLSAGLSALPSTGETGRRSTLLMWGSLDGSVRDTIGTLGTQEVVARVVDGMPQPLAVAWGVDGIWATGGGRLYYGSTDEAEIRVFDRAGALTRIVRWPDRGRNVGPEDRDLYKKKRAWLLNLFPAIADAVPHLEESAASGAVPIFRSFLMDDAGDLWVRRYPAFLAGRPDLYDLDVPLRYTPPPGTEAEVWLLFDPNGRWLGEVHTPPDLSVRAVGQGLVIGVWRDALDIEHVRAYPLHKPE